ncbi:MAG: protein kinase [Chloroflexota bacterium]|jgi:WD40 repeat protein/DNA-binding SARP family transcriptional activator
MMSGLALYTLGAARVELDGEPLKRFRSNRVPALLFYLAAEAALHGTATQRRENLIALLWPDYLEKSGRANLRQALYLLRQRIPRLDAEPGQEDSAIPFILSDYQTVQINPDVTFEHDLAEFNHLLKRVRFHDHPELIACWDCRQHLKQAIALYRDPFLADFYLPDCSVFERWAMTIREKVQRQVLDALETLTIICLREREYPQAEEYARRQLAIDNLRESAYRLLMETLARSGRRAEALAEYEACRRHLAEELGMAPTTGTTSLYEKIQTGDLDLTTAVEHDMRGYELKEQVGVGAFFAVYRAIQPEIGREVAIKIIQPQYANRSGFIRSFEREGQLVAQLEHPHIVPLYDYWRAPDGAYLVMRWYGTGSLAAALQNGPWSLEATAGFVDQIASALATAHRQGIVHRDIKPDNILVDDDGNAFLSDFGFAKVLGEEEELAPSMALTDSPKYVSPEHLLDEPISPASDQYCFGLTIYEVLTGQHPFADLSMAEMVDHQLHKSIPLVSELRNDCPFTVDEVIQKATAKQPEDRFPDVLSLAAAFREAVRPAGGAQERPLPIVSSAVVDRPNPYRGLRAFQEADAPLFYGRSSFVERLVSRLLPYGGQPPPDAGAVRFLAVVGPSGSGKSSVVKAGLIPALRQGALPGSDKWFVAEMTPGAHPLEELEQALLQIAVDSPPSLLEPLEKDERGLLRVLGRVLPAGVDGERGQLLLFIDQFEELFILGADRSAQEHFLANLLTAMNDPQSQLRVVIALRADFYDQPLQYAPIGELLQERTELVLPLTPAELEEAICRPAASVGVTVEQGLVAAISSDVQEQPGALPLIQYALTELFERRQSDMMSVSVYKDIGGVTGALGRQAETLFAALDDAGQERARQIFLRLVTLGEGVEDTRRRVPLAELESLSRVEIEEAGAAPSKVSQIIEAYGRARLLTLDHDPVWRTPTVEVAHEALLREWPRMRDWLADHRSDVRLQRLLASAADEWQEAGQDEGYLLRGARLTQFDEWALASPVALTEGEQSLIVASLAAREDRQAAERSRQMRELEAAQHLAETEMARATEQAQSAQRLRKRAVMLAGLLVVAVLLAVVAIILGQQARENAQVAASERDAAVAAQATTQAEAHFRATAEAIAQQESALSFARELSMAAINHLSDDPELSILLALKSVAVADTVEAENTLHWALQDSRVRLRVTDQSASGKPAAIFDVAYHPEGTTFATGGADNVARVWEAATGELVWSLNGHDDFIQALAYSPDGNLLATAGNDLTARVWDLKTGQAIWTLNHPDAVDDVEFSPDGATLATASYDGGARLWNLETGALEHRFPVGDCIDVTFSPDGKLLATTSVDSTAQIWDLASGERRQVLRGHTDWVLGSAFSPDSRQLATAGMDAGPLIWDVETGELLLDPGNRSATPDVAYSPDGQQIAVAYADGDVYVWNLEEFMADSNSAPAVWLAGHENRVSSIAFDPNGRFVVTGSWDGTARIWDLSGTGEIQTLTHDHITEGAAFSPDGRYLAIGVYETGDVIVWDVASGTPAVTLNQGPGDFWNVVFSPDGQQLAAAFHDGTVAVWELAEPDQILFKNTSHYAHLAYASGATGLAYSPNGQLLASAGENGSVFIWDSGTGDKKLTITGHGPSASPGVFEGIFSVAFSPDGKWLATGGADGNIMVWDIGDLYDGGSMGEMMDAGQELFSLSGHESAVLDVEFSPDGRLLASSDYDALAIVWDLGTREPLFDIRTAASLIGDVDFSPDGRLLALASHDGFARVWDVAKQREWLKLYHAESGGVCEVAFSPDSTQLVATGCRDRQARFFALVLDDLVVLAQSRLTRDLTEDECRDYLHIESCQMDS